MKFLVSSIGLFLMARIPAASACAVCFGDPNSSLTQSIGWGVWTLMGFIFGVLILFATLFLNIRRRMKRLQTAH